MNMRARSTVLREIGRLNLNPKETYVLGKNGKLVPKKKKIREDKKVIDVKELEVKETEIPTEELTLEEPSEVSEQKKQKSPPPKKKKASSVTE